MAGVGELVAFYVGVLAYVASTVAFFGQLTRRAPVGGPNLAPGLLGVGALAHAVYITLASLVAKVCPVESVHFALSVASLVACVAYLLGRVRFPIDIVGAFVAPIGLTFLLGTRFVGLGDVGKKLPPMFLTLHVAANLIGDALFFLACVTAGLYLFAETRLKQKRSSSIMGRLPPLDALDRAEHRFLLIGFPLLTIGIVTGTAWAQRLEAGQPGEVLRAAFGYLTWLVFAGVLLLRAAAGWRGRRAALGTIAGFFFAVLVLLVYWVRPSPAQAAPRSAAPTTGAVRS
jgi:ABC-type uncharacterized transport system permease subunit